MQKNKSAYFPKIGRQEARYVVFLLIQTP